MVKYLDLEFCKLLDNGHVQLNSEEETIELVQRLRRCLYDMEKVEFSLENYNIELT